MELETADVVVVEAGANGISTAFHPPRQHFALSLSAQEVDRQRGERQNRREDDTL